MSTEDMNHAHSQVPRIVRARQSAHRKMLTYIAATESAENEARSSDARWNEKLAGYWKGRRDGLRTALKIIGPNAAKPGSAPGRCADCCPHGNRPTGNWRGAPPNSEWECSLPCCGIAFVAESPNGALAAFEEWSKEYNGGAIRPAF